MGFIEGYYFSEIAAKLPAEIWVGLFFVFGIFFIAEMIRQTRKLNECGCSFLEDWKMERGRFFYPSSDFLDIYLNGRDYEQLAVHIGKIIM